MTDTLENKKEALGKGFVTAEKVKIFLALIGSIGTVMLTLFPVFSFILGEAYFAALHENFGIPFELIELNWSKSVQTGGMFGFIVVVLISILFTILFGIIVRLKVDINSLGGKIGCFWDGPVILLFMTICLLGLALSLKWVSWSAKQQVQKYWSNPTKIEYKLKGKTSEKFEQAFLLYQPQSKVCYLKPEKESKLILSYQRSDFEEFRIHQK